MIREAIVIGGGASGLAAAIALKKKNKDVLLIEREINLGGILNQCIHNGFGLDVFKEEYTGPEYAKKFVDEFRSMKIDYLIDTTVIDITKEKNHFYVTITSEDCGIKTIISKSIIISTGCYERTRGQIVIPGDRPRGVITAGSAQRYLNINGYLVGKRVFILGSGDIGLIMARRMQLEGASVLGVAEIMPYSNGLNRNIVQCLNDFNIPLFLSHTVTEVESDCNNKLKSITIQKVDQNFLPIKETEKIFNVDTLLLSIGLIPDITLLDNLKVDFDTRTKSVKVNQAYETSIEGLFICGNSLQVHDLVDNVSKESLRAGKAAANYLDNLVEKRQVINVIPGKNTLFTTPQMIDFGWVNQELVLNFRVQKKIDKAKIKVYQGEEVIFEKIKTFLAPAEMETLSFDYKNLHKNKDLLLEVEDISL